MKTRSSLIALLLTASLLLGGWALAFGQSAAAPQSESPQTESEGQSESIAQQRAYVESQLASAQSLAEGQPEGSTAVELLTAYLQAQVALDALEQARSMREQTLQQLAELDQLPEPGAARVELPELPELQDLELVPLEELVEQAQQRARELAAALDSEQLRSKLQEQERASLPEQLLVLRTQLRELAAQLATPDASQELLQAQLLRNSIQGRRYEAEIAAIQARLDFLQADARREGPRERQLEVEENAWEERAAALDRVLDERRIALAEDEAVEADKQADLLEDSRFGAQAKRIATLKDVLVTRQRSRDEVERNTTQISKTLEILDERFEALRERYKNAGRTNQMGPLLRNEARQLEEPVELRRDLEQLQPKIILRTMQLLDAEEELARLRKQGTPPDAGEADADVAQGLYEEELDTWVEIRVVLRDLRNNLEGELDVRQRKLKRTNEFAAYVNERVLWVQSAAPIWRWSGAPDPRTRMLPAGADPTTAPGAAPEPSGASGPEAAPLEWLTRDVVSQPVNRVQSLGDAVAWLGNPGHWAEVAACLWNDIARRPALWALMALVLLTLLLLRRHFLQRLDLLFDEGQGPAVAVYSPLIECTLVTALLALPIPLLFEFLGQRLANASPDGSLLSVSLGLALRPAALLWFQLAFTRISCRPEGLVPSHLHVPGEIARLIRRRILLIGATMVVSLVVFRILAAYGNQAGGSEEYVNTLGRLVFPFLMGLLVFFRHGLVRRNRDRLAVPNPLDEEHIGEFAKRLGKVFRHGLLIGVVLLSIASMLGYVYTASALFERLLLTLSLIGGLLLTQLIVLRLVEITKRRLAVERVRAQLAADGPQDPDPAVESGPEQPNLSLVSVQARQWLSTLVGILAAIGLYVIWIEVVPALGIFRQVELWDVEEASTAADGSLTGTTATIAVTLADLLLSIFWVLAGLVTGKRLPVLIDLLVFERTKLRGGERYAIQAISRYILTLIGLALGFAALRIGWNDVQFLAAAVSVGLGFGLQEIFANFVSGLILLFERPVRIGDWVAIGDITGQVARIQIRATTVQDLDRRELIVPNKDFVTSRLINYTLTDSITRVRIEVGIAYGSDTKLAKRLLTDCAKRTMGVVAQPPSKALFLGFGDSSLNFTLFVFIEERERIQDIRSDLHFKIDEAFRKEGIEISFPQRDLHVRTASGLEHIAELARLHEAERAAGTPEDARPPESGGEVDPARPKGPLDV